MPFTIPKRYLTLTAAALAIALASIAMPRSASAGGGCHTRGSSDASSTTVAMRNNCFAATVTRVDEGATVTFINEDEVAHNVTGAGYAWGGEVELYGGDSVEHVFDENGVYVYSCLLHPGMVGAIVVGDGTGLGAATVSLASSSDAGGAGSSSEPAPADAASAAAADDSSIMPVAFIAGGVALLLAIIGGSVALAPALASRRARTQ
jgi:plastocyanin